MSDKKIPITDSNQDDAQEATEKKSVKKIKITHESQDTPVVDDSVVDTEKAKPKKIAIRDFSESDEQSSAGEVDVEETATENTSQDNNIDSEVAEISEDAPVQDAITDDENDVTDDLLSGIEVNEDQPLRDDLDTSKDLDLTALTEADERIIESELAHDDIELDRSKTIEEAIADADENEKYLDDLALDTSDGDVFEPNSDVDAVVDEIVRAEGDDSMHAADARAWAVNKPKKGFKTRIGNFFRSWWDIRSIRYGTLAAIVLMIALVSVLPKTRYWVLNNAGVRVASNVTVIDSQTRLPLKNISVQLQGNTETTDDEGKVNFSKLRLGPSELKITKRGYAEISKTVTLGWGSNPLREEELLATGERYTFVLSDWITGKAIIDAEASVGESVASANDDGEIVLTIGEDNFSELSITVRANGYRDELLPIEELDKEQTDLKMVSNKKHVFVSTRDGKHDIYKRDLDGKNEEILLEATEKERDTPTVLMHPINNNVAIVSSRDGESNDDGYVYDGLYVLDAEDGGEVDRITRSEQLQLIGWSGDHLVYWQVIEGTSAGNPERSKLISYNVVTQERVDLASSNYFNDVELVGDRVYYSVSSYAVPKSQAKFFSINKLGKDKKTIIDAQVWDIYRDSYDKLIVAAEDQSWHEMWISSEATQKLDVRPNPVQLNFVESPDSSKVAWVEIRDGKGVVLTSDVADISGKPAFTKSGIDEVLYWVNEQTIVYRVINSDETADYLLNLEESEPVKISDVTTSKRNLRF